MNTETEDTIAAIATPMGRAALGTIRISGSRCRDVVSEIFETKKGKIDSFRPMVGKINLAQESSIDEAVLIFYEAPHSYTREDLAEITCHGNPFILERIMKRILETNVRLATPGEFTFRAFLNGRLDLVQAEAVNDLITADSQYQAEIALQQLDGRLSAALNEIKTAMLEFVALLEGNIDFSEEQHYHFIERSEARNRIVLLQTEVQNLLGTFERGQLIRDGIQVTLAGKPNVGKSSIFNSLLGKDRAIVTPLPGTTRDFLRERIVLGGMLVHLLDTAGIRESNEEVEKEGVRRSRQAIENSELILFVLDGSQSPDEKDVELWHETAGKDRIVLFNKSDESNFHVLDWFGERGFPVSAKTGAGFNDLLLHVQKTLERRLQFSNDSSMISSLRHRDLLKDCLKYLERGLKAMDQGASEEFVVLELHHALKHLSEITGEITIEDIYTEIFSKFCIGK